MTRAEMKKIYAKVFLGILIFALFVAAIFIAGEVRRRLDTGEQYLIKEAEPPRLLTVKANVSVPASAEDGEEGQVLAMREIREGKSHYFGMVPSDQLTGGGWPVHWDNVASYAQKGTFLLELECDGIIEIESKGLGVATGRIRADGNFEELALPNNRIDNRLGLSVDGQIRYGSGPGSGNHLERRIRIPTIAHDDRKYHSYSSQMLTEFIPGVPYELRDAWRYVKETTLFVTCYDRTDPERVIAEAEIRVRCYENFRLDARGVLKEYDAALRQHLGSYNFQSVDLTKYYAHTEIEMVHYAQIEIWD